MNAFALADYTGSKDYWRLAELTKEVSVICLVDYNGQREVARTSYTARRAGDFWTVASGGIGHIHAFSLEDFVSLCEHRQLEFIEPPGFPCSSHAQVGSDGTLEGIVQSVLERAGPMENQRQTRDELVAALRGLQWSKT